MRYPQIKQWLTDATPKHRPSASFLPATKQHTSRNLLFKPSLSLETVASNRKRIQQDRMSLQRSLEALIFRTHAGTTISTLNTS